MSQEITDASFAHLPRRPSTHLPRRKVTHLPHKEIWYVDYVLAKRVDPWTAYARLFANVSSRSPTAGIFHHFTPDFSFFVSSFVLTLGAGRIKIVFLIEPAHPKNFSGGLILRARASA
jgi:hypothetical protein